MLWLFEPIDKASPTDCGLLSYDEADLFLRAGDDMRVASWPAGQFVRISRSTPTVPEGYTVRPYLLSRHDKRARWGRA